RDFERAVIHGNVFVGGGRTKRAPLELFLEKDSDLIPGEGHGDEVVLEVLGGEEVSVGDLAAGHTGRGGVVREAGADASLISKGDDGAAFVGWAGELELSVGDEIAHGVLAGGADRSRDFSGER